MTRAKLSIWAIGALTAAYATGCASTLGVKKQDYAELSSQRTFESPLKEVSKGVELALKDHKIAEKRAEDKRYTLETDWIYGQSRDKYHEYTVNGSPRRRHLQTRFKYFVNASSSIAGTDVSVRTQEEIELLRTDGSPAGYTESDAPDSSRAAELLEKINIAVLSASGR